MTALGGDPTKINPLIPVHLVIDHSVMVDDFGNAKAFERQCRAIEYQRNLRALRLPEMGQLGLQQLPRRSPRHRHLPPGEPGAYLAQTVWTADDAGHPRQPVAYPDTVVGTDSHTTMVNGLAVLGWGVGGIEAEAAMLGQPSRC